MRCDANSWVRGCALTVSAVAAVAGAPIWASAQESPASTAARTIILGQVTGAALDEPLAGAMVYIQGQNFTAVTDSIGLYALEIPPGAWVLSMYHPRAAELGLERAPTNFVTVDAGTKLRVDFTLAEDVLGSQASPYVLEALSVMVEASRTVERRDVGANVQVLRPEVLALRQKSARHVGDLIQGQFTGVRVLTPRGPDVCVEASRAAMVRTLGGPRYCEGRVAVIIDDIMVDNPGGFLESLPPDAVVRVEFMPAYDASTRYGRRAANGALLIWTR